MTVVEKRRGRKRGSRGPNPVDIHVGRQLRLRRTLLGMTQEKLGEALGMTFQQVQKYERGTNRIGCSRLFDLSRVLDVSVDYFFEDIADEVAAALPARQRGGWSDQEQESFHLERDPMARRETLELVRAYYKVPTEDLRRELFELVKTLAVVVAERKPRARKAG